MNWPQKSTKSTKTLIISVFQHFLRPATQNDFFIFRAFCASLRLSSHQMLLAEFPPSHHQVPTRPEDPLGNFLAALDIHHLIHEVIEINLIGKICFVCQARLAAHFQCPPFVHLGDLVKAIDIFFWNDQCKFTPFQTLWENPVIGEDDRRDPHAHRLEESHAGATDAARADTKLRCYNDFAILLLPLRLRSQTMAKQIEFIRGIHYENFRIGRQSEDGFSDLGTIPSREGIEILLWELLSSTYEGFNKLIPLVCRIEIISCASVSRLVFQPFVRGGIDAMKQRHWPIRIGDCKTFRWISANFGIFA